MYEKLSNTITRIVQFTNEHKIVADFHIHSVGDLKGKNGCPDTYWAKFEKHAGVYLLLNCDDKTVHYIGMSQTDTGSRLYKWLFKENNNINKAVSASDLVLSVVLKKQPYMSPALESYLISKLKPTLNKKR